MKKKLYYKWHVPSHCIKNGNAEYYIRKGIKFERLDYNGRIVYKLYATYHEYYCEITSHLEMLLIDADVSHLVWVILALHKAKNLDEYVQIYDFALKTNKFTIKELAAVVTNLPIKKNLLMAINQPDYN